jgi:hypothetical protein
MPDDKNKVLPKEQRQLMLKVINREAQKRGIINRRQTLTPTKLTDFASEIGLTGRERLAIDRQKKLSGQTDSSLVIIFKKLNYKAQGKLEQGLELAQKIGKVTGSVRRVEIINFDTLIDYGTKSNQDLNQLSDWNWGLIGNNTIVNQNFIPFLGEENA